MSGEQRGLEGVRSLVFCSFTVSWQFRHFQQLAFRFGKIAKLNQYDLEILLRKLSIRFHELLVGPGEPMRRRPGGDSDLLGINSRA